MCVRWGFSLLAHCFVFSFFFLIGTSSPSRFHLFTCRVLYNIIIISLFTAKQTCIMYVCMYVCRTEGNDQESIQLPNTFRPRHQTERRTHLKQRHHNQNSTSRNPKGQFLSQFAKRLSKIKKITRTYIQRHIMKEIVNHSRSTAL